jgi:hypothetical protein
VKILIKKPNGKNQLIVIEKRVKRKSPNIPICPKLKSNKVNLDIFK